MSVVEIVRFETKPGTGREEFAAVDARVGAEYVSQQPGFIDRQTASNGDQWLVIVHWKDTDSADASMEKYETAPAAAEQMSYMTAGSMSMQRFVTVN